MRTRTIVVVGAVWVASLFVAGKVATAQARGFVRLPEPKVLSGADLGFRVDGMYGEMPAGTVVIRVNGKWIQPVAAPSTQPLNISTHATP